MKRVLAFILAVYVTALTLDPCVDSERTCTGSQVPLKETGTTHHDSDHKDMCSPFCSCSCCSISMEVAKILILPVTPVLYSTLAWFYEPQPIAISLTPVWQPPKA